MNVESAKWVFTWNSNETGKAVKTNARLVAINRRFGKRPGVDYTQSLAPTPAASRIHLMNAIACGL